MNFLYVQGGLLGRREYKSEMGMSFTGEKKLGVVAAGLVVLSAAPSPPEKFVRLVLVLLFLPQTTADGGGGVVALAGLPFSEKGGRSRRFRKTAYWYFLDLFVNLKQVSPSFCCSTKILVFA